MKLRFIPLFLCLLLLTGCGMMPQSGPSADDICNIDTQRMPVSEDELFEMLFDIHNKITLSLDMEEAEIAKMQTDYEAYDQHGSKSPIFRRADLTVSLTLPDGNSHSFLIEDVGVRMKGNTSRTDFYSAEDGIYNLTHLKLSFQETFDDENYYGSDTLTWDEADRTARKDRTFATLEKLDLRWNRCDDGTYLKEYFAYETYRQYGVPAPHTNLASFDWAGIHMGVFTINEPVDKIFLSKNLPEEALGGDLYKCGWAGYHNGSFLNTDSIGIENEDTGEFYAYDLKTNKKTSGHEALTALIRNLNDGDVTKAEIAELIDLDTFLPFSAVSYLVGNPDDMRNNYNNFYLYFRADNGKAVFIPYDYDRCLGITAHWNPTHTGLTDDDPFTSELLSVDRSDNSSDRTQKNPVIIYSVAEGGYYVREYAEILSEIAGGNWFTVDHFTVLHEIAQSHYADLTTPAKSFRNAEGLHLSFDIERTSDFASNGNISIQAYMDAKLRTLQNYLSDVDRYANAEPQVPPTWYIRGTFNDWGISDDYVMTEENGLFTFCITAAEKVALKVYNANTDHWFGTEYVNKDCPVWLKPNSHNNIVLEAGEYSITIDPDREKITLARLS